MTLEDIKRSDPSGMYEWIRDFHRQVEDGVKIGKTAKVKLNVRGISNVVLTGLGGSAIGGDLLRSYLADEFPVPFIINRHYSLADFVDKNSLVVVSSYSGNTEETIAAHRDATKRKAKVICISTGGETEKLAGRYKQPWVQIPAGYSPRAALGYSFFPLLMIFSRLGFVKSKEKDVRETIGLLQSKSMVFSDPDSSDNNAFRLAQQLKGRLPIIYSANEHLDAVNIRWRGQIAENAKQLGFGHVLPEMNHNELVGWKVLGDLMKQMHVVFLRDKGTHKRVAVRENITKGIVSQYTPNVSEVWSEGTTLLARMFSLIHFGDWVSFYLAVLNNEDPTPVKVIDFLKSELAKV
ncbi:MAG: bifunctional phosphoglucose/phosphomannose isomerase [Ignavibacteriales bacterium]|nr:bifunctional phosphoglucose/phosphomannose isomerase [Ignavibacteriales bacterium]